MVISKFNAFLKHSTDCQDTSCCVLPSKASIIIPEPSISPARDTTAARLWRHRPSQVLIYAAPKVPVHAYAWHICAVNLCLMFNRCLICDLSDGFWSYPASLDSCLLGQLLHRNHQAVPWMYHEAMFEEPRQMSYPLHLLAAERSRLLPM